MLELPDYVYAAAKALISQNSPLPIPIQESRNIYYLAIASDTSFLAFGGIEVDGVIYKIGVKKVGDGD
jgi:hypothetical protein